ncbi:hydrogenase maturation nickel metallochaperone HypA [Subtercola sp. PAMC28395]|uniref:hydrogenase maturation nickel metallochaperone HypA n=1 Tax=Subtercola sp. PAMC28395 TaxID=2846775 RepID=UPI001C0B3BF7|nr:hydrogenase maturation nickel metallochaperone HypA [Subtercola sp. PAMC28395]QWT23104.1 hydrogenase maturation nickel metallochaperone HypA [Subtercola sp. PAMC28395]
MHELSLCRSIYGIAERAAAGRAVTQILLDVGQLRQVVPETLVYCWGVVTEESALEGSQLRVTSIPAVIACADCGANTTLQGVPMLLCGRCGGGSVSVTSGEEFLVRSIDVKD